MQKKLFKRIFHAVDKKMAIKRGIFLVVFTILSLILGNIVGKEQLEIRVQEA
jgi:NADH:ubiquinone oxidoreductase subunit 2 (subunit N)